MSINFELGIHGWTQNTYAVEAHCTFPPSSDGGGAARAERVDETENHIEVPDLKLPRDELATLVANTPSYGKALSDFVFADGGVCELFGRALGQASPTNPLRLRLRIGSSATELHALRWEALLDPVQDSPIATNQSVLFSRYASSSDWHRIYSRSRTNLRALVVASCPTDMDKRYPGMARFDAESEAATAKEYLGFAEVAELITPGVTLSRLLEHLRDGCDILYVVCHGVDDQDDPCLLLERDEAGETEEVPASKIVRELADLPQRPRLVVLASCYSASGGDGLPADAGTAPTCAAADGGGTSRAAGFLSAIGPRLARVGVPAVLGMHGPISQVTARRFMATFFRELEKDGVIDHAVAVARGEVRDRPDWWMPVLLTRLKSCELWYTAGLRMAAGDSDFARWQAVVSNMKRRECRCLPIVGPGIGDAILGPRDDAARSLATKYRFPLCTADCERLGKVAEFVAISQQPAEPRDAFVRYVGHQAGRCLEEHPEGIEAAMRDAAPVLAMLEPQLRALCETDDELPDEEAMEADRRVVAAVCRHWGKDKTGSLQALAELPFHAYVSADPSSLLASALIKAGKNPVLRLWPWRKAILDLGEAAYKRLPADYKPTEQSPLVYYLYGHFAVPNSMVLTEDDYLSYVVGTERYRDLLSKSKIADMLGSHGLLFLGFQVEDWDFRVAMRQVGRHMNKGDEQDDGGGASRAHVAVQLEPQDDRMLEPDRAREFVRHSLNDRWKTSIYLGTALEFLRELRDRLKGGLDGV